MTYIAQYGIENSSDIDLADMGNSLHLFVFFETLIEKNSYLWFKLYI